MEITNRYNSCAVPFAILESIRKNDIPDFNKSTGFSLNANTDRENNDSKLKLITHILQKILIRGKYVLVSEYEEEIIAQYLWINISKTSKSDFNSEEWKRFSTMVSVLHKLELAITEGLFLWITDFNNNPEIWIDINNLSISSEDLSFLVDTVLKENFWTLFDYLSMSYNYGKFFSNLAIYITDDFTSVNWLFITDSTESINNSIKIQIDDNSNSITNVFYPLSKENLEARFSADIDEEIINFFFTYVFRKKYFREWQYDSIKNILIGNDTLVLLPTGSGKSVIFQLAGILLPGTTIVICPLVSLIEDQMDNLERIGIDNIVWIINAWNSDKKQALEEFERWNPLMVYVSPEKFLTKEFRGVLSRYKEEKLLSMVVIDEAHCCSEWWHDFRTSYLNIWKTSRKVCSSSDFSVRFAALTWTASNAVLKDMQRELKITDYKNVITPKSFERKELEFEVISCSSKEKFKILEKILQNDLPEYFNKDHDTFFKSSWLNTAGGVIFCPHTSWEFWVDEISNKINWLGIQSQPYWWKKQWNWSDKEWEKNKILVTQKFKDNEYPILVATKWFWMGIDKPNIRYTVHYWLPNSMESFYQEAGRAWRDWMQAKNYLIISNDDTERTKKLLDLSTSPSEINSILQKTSMDKADDLTRALWFHYQSFKWINEEIKFVETLIKELVLNENKIVEIAVGNWDRSWYEKAIQRLLILWILEDYTLDYAKNTFEFIKGDLIIDEAIDNYLEYVNSYNPSKGYAEKLKTDKILSLTSTIDDKYIQLSSLLIKFVYDTIEKWRRRAIKEMLSLSECKKPEEVSAKILKYLEGSKNELLDRVVNEKDIKFTSLKEVVDWFDEGWMAFWWIVSQKEAEKMKWYVSRYLEWYPDNPQLLMLKWIMEAFSKDPDIKSVVEDFILWTKFAKTKYWINTDFTYASIIWAIHRINKISWILSEKLLNDLVRNINDIFFVRYVIISDIDEEMLLVPYSIYFMALTDQINWLLGINNENDTF